MTQPSEPQAADLPAFMRPLRGNAAWLALILLTLVLHLLMIRNGGAFVWPDEQRATRTISLAAQLTALDFKGVAESFFLAPEHTLFRFVLLPVASFLSNPDQLWVAQLWLSFIGIAIILLITRIARQWGATPLEAWWCGVLLALSSTALYHTRHLLPYDSASLIALLGVWLGSRPQYRLWHSVGVGVLVGAVFMTYNGYWVLAVVVGVLHLVGIKRSFRLARVQRVLGLMIAFCIWLGIGVLISNGVGKSLDFYVEILAGFSTTVRQGEFSAGWYFPFENLWVVERVLGLVWFGAVGYALWLAYQRRLPRRAGLALFAIGLLYGLLALFSTGLQFFVVYGRLVRMIVPYLALLAGFVIVQFKGRWQVALGLVLVFNALFTIRPILTIVFPPDFQAVVVAQYGDVEAAPAFVPSTTPFVPTQRYVIYGTDLDYFTFHGWTPPPAGKIVLEYENAYDFLPYFYEGFTAKQRRIVAEQNIPLLLIDTQAR